MDELTYQTVLENWAYRVEECRRIQADAAERYGFSSQEYQRAKAMTYGYRAAIQAAESSRAALPAGVAQGAGGEE